MYNLPFEIKIIIVDYISSKYTLKFRITDKDNKNFYELLNI